MLEGRFERPFVPEFKALPHLPDTVRFRNGNFQVILGEWLQPSKTNRIALYL